MHLSLMGGIELALRDQIGHNTYPAAAITEYEEAWDIDVTMAVNLTFDM